MPNRTGYCAIPFTSPCLRRCPRTCSSVRVATRAVYSERILANRSKTATQSWSPRNDTQCDPFTASGSPDLQHFGSSPVATSSALAACPLRHSKAKIPQTTRPPSEVWQERRDQEQRPVSPTRKKRRAHHSRLPGQPQDKTVIPNSRSGPQ